jgi:glycogen operon protein
MPVGPGTAEPLGVTLVDDGANVAVCSCHASAIELCLFAADGATETERIRLPERTGDVFHGFVTGIAAGTRYGLRAYGPWDLRAGHRFNPVKLLVDPYARALDRRFAFDPALAGAAADPRARDPRDTAALVPKAIATATPNPASSVGPRVAWSDTIVYELHVRGFTRTHPAVPEPIRGTCAGLAHPAAITHLLRLGVTTVELMPLAATIDERHLWQRSLTNYWGYNPVAWFVPDPRLAPGGIDEVRRCVDALHAAGLEVVLDIVLNHSGEGDAEGPTLSLRGLDNALYYRTVAGNAARYVDDAGCGNTLALERPPVLRLALDVLRYYAETTGIDGFRLDLATTLARRDGEFDPDAPLLQAIAQDPRLRELKLIVEPWDLGPGGYRLGEFPARWGEWNDRFRDDVRRFWRGDPGFAGRLATRIAGSADAFAAPRRRPSCSVNFVAAHDGFTLADVVAYAVKHNEANGESNRDGTESNGSWNHGVEGATDDPAVTAARARDVRSLIATLLVSRGTPMLAMGDELRRTQRGNNNTYAQDNALAWVDWANADEPLTAFVATLVSLRRRNAALRLDRWLDGSPQDDSGIPDVEWRRPDGEAMASEHWTHPDTRALVATFYAPAAAGGAANRVVVAFNANATPIPVRWPEPRRGFAWFRKIDTSREAEMEGTLAAPEINDAIAARAVVVLVEEPVASSRTRRTGIETAVLGRLAEAAGIESAWWDIAGKRHEVDPDTKRSLLAAMGLSINSTDDARERLRTLAAKPQEGAVTVSPERAHLPESLAAGVRRFGLAAQLYALRRPGDQGIGDLTTLALAGAATARAGGALLGINPLHALFANERERASPYHPSDRRFLDPIYIDVERLPDLAHSRGPRAAFAAQAHAFAALAARADVDYGEVWRAKRAVLEACFTAFETRPDQDPLALEFARYCTAGGEALASFARFEAIADAHPRVPWRRWPAGLRRPDATDVKTFADRHARAVRFACYLQWQADRQLAAAAESARAAGLSLGLYRDLAVGSAPDGAETWSQPEAYASGAWIGAPPDPFATAGQNWNLPPPIPHAMTAGACAAFRALVAANMRHAGALRIDHVMGLSRLFWIPDGATPSEGAYVRYPLDALLAALALESRRAQCLVVGEDLGTVPEGLRERLAESDILSYRVVWLERDVAGFVDPSRYPSKAAACVTTHDLPTIAGWWSGADIAERHALGLAGADDAGAALRARRSDKALLASAIHRAGVTAAIDPDGPHDASVTAAVHGFASAAPSALLLIQADDLAGENAAPNLPCTDRERENWRRKIRVDTAALWTTTTGVQTLAACANRRGPVGTSG